MWSYFKLEILQESLNRKNLFYNSSHRNYHEDFNEVPVLIQKTGEGRCWEYYFADLLSILALCQF